MAAETVERIPLGERSSIPQLGVGVWQIDNDEVPKAVGHALEVGYRLIDTAQGYDNERGVGRALRNGSRSLGDLSHQ